MDSNITEKISEMIQNHKILSISISFIALFLILLILLLTSFKSQNKPSNSNQNITPNKSDLNIQQQSEVQKPDTSTWIKGSTSDYSILFPPEWTPTTQAIEGGGTFVTLIPPKLSEATTEIEYPQITIQSTPIANRTAAQFLSTLSPLGFPKEKTTFESLPATTLSGTLPIKPTKDNPNQSLIHVTYIIFEHGNDSYKISLTDYEDADQKINEALVNSIIQTIAFN